MNNDTTLSAYQRVTTDRDDPALEVRMSDGTMKKYLVLPDILRIGGLQNPIRTDIVHRCGHAIRLMLPIAETIAAKPLFYKVLFCTKCVDHFPISQFVWLEEPNLHVGQLHIY